MSTKRRQYTASFKAKVATEAIIGDLTLSQLASKYSVHQTQINTWKKQAMQGITGIFSGKVVSSEQHEEKRIKELHAKIGQLLVENDFLHKASGH